MKETMAAILGLVFVIWFGTAHNLALEFAESDPAKASKGEGAGEHGFADRDVLERLTDFSVSEGSHINLLIKELEQAEVALKANIGELQSVLDAFGRESENDPDLISWKNQLESLKVDRAQLRGMLEEAFIWPEKFRLALSAEHKAAYTVRITECKDFAAALSGRYRENCLT